METTFGLPSLSLAADRRSNCPNRRLLPETRSTTTKFLCCSAIPLAKHKRFFAHWPEPSWTPMLHGAVYQMTRIYEQNGQKFCEHVRYRANDVAGKVLDLSAKRESLSRMLEKIPRQSVVAMISGWAVEPNADLSLPGRRGFSASDHADYDRSPALCRFGKAKTSFHVALDSPGTLLAICAHAGSKRGR